MLFHAKLNASFAPRESTFVVDEIHGCDVRGKCDAGILTQGGERIRDPANLVSAPQFELHAKP